MERRQVLTGWPQPLDSTNWQVQLLGERVERGEATTLVGGRKITLELVSRFLDVYAARKDWVIFDLDCRHMPDLGLFERMLVQAITEDEHLPPADGGISYHRRVREALTRLAGRRLVLILRNFDKIASSPGTHLELQRFLRGVMASCGAVIIATTPVELHQILPAAEYGTPLFQDFQSIYVDQAIRNGTSAREKRYLE
ncbi:MAG: hypothetical protein HY326_12790 [Chloroflexi bacterium]|nr:hypothetical protein [Chloroflexota bacterium]